MRQAGASDRGGGRPGFLKVLDPHSLAFADYQGNRQLLSTGNLAANSRVALFLMDYPQRERLKILGHATVKDAREHPELISQLVDESDRKIVERIFLIDVISFDWNCPKYITPRHIRRKSRPSSPRSGNASPSWRPVSELAVARVHEHTIMHRRFIHSGWAHTP